jgi:opacity protein-like surface antigen
MSGFKVLVGAACALFCAFAAVPASAQSLEGLYARADLAWSFSTNANIHDRNFPVDQAIHGNLSDIGSGWSAGGGLGMQFIPNVRGDLTYTYRGGHDLDQLDQNAPPTRFQADFSSQAVMASGYYDFSVGYPGIVPFVGVGLGWSDVRIGNLTSISAAGTRVAPAGSQDNFAWQLMAGVGFDLSYGLKVDLFYRYFDGGHFQSQTGNVISGGVVVGTYHGAEGAFHVHELGASLRIPVNP